MKTRLFGLLLLCLGLLGALFLMAESGLPPEAEPRQSYVQCAALPPLPPAAPPSEKAAAVEPAPPAGEGTGAREEREALPVARPEARLPYYRLVYYAFHLSDEAG